MESPLRNALIIICLMHSKATETMPKELIRNGGLGNGLQALHFGLRTSIQMYSSLAFSYKPPKKYSLPLRTTVWGSDLRTFIWGPSFQQQPSKIHIFVVGPLRQYIDDFRATKECHLGSSTTENGLSFFSASASASASALSKLGLEGLLLFVYPNWLSNGSIYRFECGREVLRQVLRFPLR